MPRRITVLSNGEIYHVINRGINSSPIYNSAKDYNRFYELLNYYLYNPVTSYSSIMKIPLETRREVISNIQKNNKKTIEIYAYCLMPNHYHILMKQLTDGGISKFLSNIQNAYVRYFNLKYQKKGPMFESSFKSIRIENDSQLLHVSRYIHLNPSSSFVVQPQMLGSYPWSSFNDYSTNRPKHAFINSKKIIDIARGIEQYTKFVLDHADYQKRLNHIKHLVLE